MYRIADRVIARLAEGVKALGLPAEDEAKIGWEVNPILLSKAPGTMPQLGYAVALSVPVPSTEDDFILHMEPLTDAHADQETVSALVAKLYASATAEAREQRVRIATMANGERRTDGGLVIPE